MSENHVHVSDGDRVTTAGAEEIRKVIATGLRIAHAVLLFAPLNIREPAAKVLAVVERLSEQDWFVQLLAYVIGSLVAGKVPSAADVRSVLPR